MKTIKIKLENEYEVEMPDDYDYKKDDGEELFKKLGEKIVLNNNTPENEFWESLEIVGEV